MSRPRYHFRLLTSKQYHSHPLHDTRIRCGFPPLLLVLLARYLLPGHIRLLRSFCDRLILRPPLPLHCPEPARTKGILPWHTTKGMGSTSIVVQEMLRWRKGALANAQEWIDLVQHHLDRDLPVLFHQSNHDCDRCAHPILWEILSVLGLAIICPYLGKFYVQLVCSVLIILDRGH